MFTFALLTWGLLWPIPMLMLLGSINQRRRYRWERQRHLDLLRISRGGRR